MQSGRATRTRGWDYFEESRRPWPSLVFLLPLLLCYELGVLWLGQRGEISVRSGADEWLRGWLGMVGLDALWWPPLLVGIGLLTWQWCARLPWRVSWETLGGMFAESVLCAFALVVLGQLQNRLFASVFPVTGGTIAPHQLAVELTKSDAGALARVLGFVGAGIYEEVLFRLTLLPLTILLLRPTILPEKWIPLVAAAVTGMLFATAHHVGPAGEPFELFRFCFRLLAGLFFAALFVLRGFGITAGSHAIYDILVGVLMVE